MGMTGRAGKVNKVEAYFEIHNIQSYKGKKKFHPCTLMASLIHIVEVIDDGVH
jgi:hypothetical protein